MGLVGIGKGRVPKLCRDIDGRVGALRGRPLEGDRRLTSGSDPGAAMALLWIDATCRKVRRGGRIVPVAAIIAIGTNPTGIGSVRRRVAAGSRPPAHGPHLGPSESFGRRPSSFQTAFLGEPSGAACGA